MTSDEIKKIVGKDYFLANDKTLAGKLIYISGIKGFDDYLEMKDQIEINSVIHIIEKPKGLILKLVKNFSSKGIALSYDDIKVVSLIEYERYSIIKILTNQNSTILFGFDNSDISEILNYFKELRKITFEENIKSEIPKEDIFIIETYLIKHTDLLPINVDKIIASKTKRLFNYLIDTSLLSILSPFLLETTNIKFENKLQSLVFSLIVFLLYYLLMEGTFKTTIGKIFTNTKVVREDGTKVDDVFIRTLCRIIPFEPFSYFFERIGWHDSISKTVVIDKGLRRNYYQQLSFRWVRSTNNETSVERNLR